MDNEVMRPKANQRTDAAVTGAVTTSPDQQLRGPARPIDRKKMDAITRKLAAMPILDSRTADEFLNMTNSASLVKPMARTGW